MKQRIFYYTLALLLFPVIGFCQENTLRLCFDGFDNDGNGLTDCEEEACLAFSDCLEERVFIPNVFSPNGDGANDLFNIYGGRGVVVIRSFSIYNGLGQLIFESKNIPPNDPQYGWDGTYRGRKLNPKQFLYRATIEFTDGSVKPYAGYVTLFN